MKVAIVNDSPLAQMALRDALSSETTLTVSWAASDGEEALEKCRADKPDIVLMDIVMPRMGGVEATRRIMKECPCPILIVTSSVDGNVAEVFEAMGAGALDAVATPPLESAAAQSALRAKIQSIATLYNPAISSPAFTTSRPVESPTSNCVLIGSSAGGPAALSTILSALPADLPAAVIIVQHIDEKFCHDLAKWLATTSRLPVEVAAENSLIQTGKVMIAPGGCHLIFGHDGRLHYTTQPASSYSPSVDVLFESAIRRGPKNLLGVILTGMGRDGAIGLKGLKDAGHLTIAQDQATSAIYGMPRAAAEIGAAREILALANIANRISEWSILKNSQ
jgi:two-component system response regulator WspF